MISSAQEFAVLVRSANADERDRAKTDEASEAVWSQIANGPSEFKVVMAVNRTLPDQFLLALARDPDEEVRAAVASRANLPAAFYNEFAADPSQEVRSELAGNRTTPTSILEQLQRDDNKWVAEVARERLKLRNKTR